MGAGIKMVANNKKAYHDYFIDDKFEAGIELFGTEVKSIRMGKCSIKEAFIKIGKRRSGVYVFVHISPYEKGNIFNKDPLRVRKLLLHKLGDPPPDVDDQKKKDTRWYRCGYYFKRSRKSGNWSGT